MPYVQFVGGSCFDLQRGATSVDEGGERLQASSCVSLDGFLPSASCTQLSFYSEGVSRFTNGNGASELWASAATRRTSLHPSCHCGPSQAASCPPGRRAGGRDVNPDCRGRLVAGPVFVPVQGDDDVVAVPLLYSRCQAAPRDGTGATVRVTSRACKYMSCWVELRFPSYSS
ncbi:hypothetical protein EJB05_27003 [Eragrostis curvula]|uniref:Uncharacterized protein n=1 Tax=Eragrostis curvula TaxID=38414 RepID=A0A5J9UMJ4_9POAL|nr:hypothetical protein EJB05_27003 [Eragrostis curvula]